MINKSEWGYCSKCGIEITNNNIGDMIEAEEKLVCVRCAEKHIRDIIRELELFRKSKEFKQELALRKKILWTSEQMGNWFDNADKSIQESVTDYDNLNLFELQFYIIESELRLVESFALDNEDYEFRLNPDMKVLREELLKEHKRILSYIDKEEFITK